MLVFQLTEMFAQSTKDVQICEETLHTSQHDLNWHTKAVIFISNYTC